MDSVINVLLQEDEHLNIIFDSYPHSSQYHKFTSGKHDAAVLSLSKYWTIVTYISLFCKRTRQKAMN